MQENIKAAVIALRSDLPQKTETVFICGKDGYKLESGEIWAPTGETWVRLSLHNNRELRGHIKVTYLDRGQLKTAWSVPVGIEPHFAGQQLRQIQEECYTGRPYAGYNVENFILRAPLRVSHTSDSLIIRRDDLAAYATEIKLSTFIESRVGTPVASITKGTMVEIQHYHYGAYILKSQVSIEGQFELFNFTFTNVSEAYVKLIALLEEVSIKSRNINVIPQIKDYSRTATQHQLQVMLTKIGKLRQEPLQLPAKKVVVQRPAIPVFDETPKKIIPPCV